VIGKPTMPQLLGTIKLELNEKIAPALSDPTHVVAVQMMSAMLDALAVRAESELAWMREECDAIELAASEYTATHHEAEAVARALAEYRDQASTSLRLSDVQAAYDRAGEVLSCLADAALGSNDLAEVRRVEELIEQRLATELAIVGTFVAAGRD
jgi:hypothetical protein